MRSIYAHTLSDPAYILLFNSYFSPSLSLSLSVSLSLYLSLFLSRSLLTARSGKPVMAGNDIQLTLSPESTPLSDVCRARAISLRSLSLSLPSRKPWYFTPWYDHAGQFDLGSFRFERIGGAVALPGPVRPSVCVLCASVCVPLCAAARNFGKGVHA